MKPEITPEILRRIARNIVESQLEDIEWLTICEMTSDALDAEEFDLTVEDEVQAYHGVDAWLNKAKITIEFEED